jgi:hypothetical protein
MLQAARPMRHAALRSYLKEGGLVKILQSNLCGGQDQPQAWLSFTSRGEVTHTFSAQRGILGGATVPHSALHEDKVLTGKKVEVASFLASFGLSKNEVEEIIAAVGTAP